MGEIINVSVDVQENGVHITTRYKGQTRNFSMSAKAMDTAKTVLMHTAEEIILSRINTMLKDCIRDHNTTNQNFKPKT